MKADLIVKGVIYDGLVPESSVKMLAVKDGVYCYVGPEKETEGLQDEHTKVITMEEGLVMPSMFEGHAHVCSGTELFRGVNLYGLRTPEQYLKAVEDYIEKHPKDEFIIGKGFINGDFNSVGPTASMLDKIARDKYIVIDSEDCHSSWVNSKVLQAVGIDEKTRELPGGVIVRDSKSGKPTGWLKEKEMDRVRNLLPGYGIEDYKEGILRYQDLALSCGIGCTYEPIMNDKKDIGLRLRAYRELEAEKRLTMQFRAGITMNPEEDIDTVLQMLMENRVDGSESHFQLMGIKVFIDGVVEGHTAFLREPYADQPGDCGINLWKQDKLNALLIKAAQKNIPIHVHVIGDGAAASALEAFEEAFKETKQKGIRNCMTHLQLVGKDQFLKMKRLGIIAVTNPFWHYKNPSYYDCIEVPYLGKKRADSEYPLKSFFDHEVVVTQASDWPVTFCFHPFIGLETAVTRREAGNKDMEPLGEAEQAEVGQMLRALTFNGAYQMEEEHRSGSIEIGKCADFILLDRNIFEIPADQIGDTAVLKHFIDGKEVFSNQNNAAWGR